MSPIVLTFIIHFHMKLHTVKPWPILFVTILFMSIGPNVNAQYKTALGIRFGGTSGLTVKHFHKPDLAVEGLVGTFGNGFSLTALLEKHLPVYEAPGLRFYYGGGLHVAFYNGRYARNSFGRDIDYRSGNDAGIGVNGIVGLEYRLPDNIPIAFSIDLKPFMEFGSNGYVAVAADPSIGIKFILP